METPATVHHPLFARFYARVAAGADGKGAAEHRHELLAGLRGRVVEVGAGTGLNFAHYPRSVTEVVAVEPEPRLRRLAARAAAHAPVPVVVVDGVAERLPAADSSFDAGVASLLLCSVADQRAALAELRRVIRPGGELRSYEHVRAATPGLARLQQALDLVWPWFGGGCHTSRRTVAAIESERFVITEHRRLRFVPSLLALPVAPHVIGVAISPGPPVEPSGEPEALFEELSRDECFRLLARQAVGRVGDSAGMHPVIVPVNYVLDGEAIVFRTDAGSKLDHGDPAGRRIGSGSHQSGSPADGSSARLIHETPVRTSIAARAPNRAEGPWTPDIRRATLTSSAAFDRRHS